MPICQILFIELLGGIGDVVIALPAIRALARSHPSSKLTILTFAAGGKLLTTDPLIDRVIVANPGQARQTVEQVLSQQTFDLIISDTNYDGIGELIQHHCLAIDSAGIAITNLWRSPPANERVGDRFLTLLQQDGWITEEAIAIVQREPQIHLTPAERVAAQQSLGALYRPLIVLCPDAGMPIKQWSVDRFIELGRALQRQVDATIVIPAGPDPEPAKQMVQAIGGSAQVYPHGPLRQFAAVMAQADVVVAADTGPARIAAALQVPTVTLFGPSWSGRYGQPAPHVNLQGFPDCPERLVHNFTEQCCWYSGECPFEWNTCLDDLSVEQVIQAVTSVLRTGGGGSWDVGCGEPEAAGTGSLPAITTAVGTFGTELDADWQQVQRLLVMRLDNIGDVLMTSPALRSLRQQLPEAEITLLCSPSGALMAPLLPWVDVVLPWRVLWQDLGRLQFNPDHEWQLIEDLQQRQFDAAIIFTSFSQSPHPAGLICALAGIPLRLGESKEQDDGTLTHTVAAAADEIHQVDRNLRLIAAVGFAPSDRQLTLRVPALSPAFSLPNRYLVLNPWTTCQSRNYDAQRFALATRQLSDKTGFPVVVTGVAKDRDRSQSLLDRLGATAIDLIGATTLSDLVALIARAELILTNNTSTMHIAEATGTPSVVLFAGTEQESQWRPRYSPSQLLRRPTVCSPCYAFTCPYELQCLEIAPKAVVAAGLELLWQKDKG